MGPLRVVPSAPADELRERALEMIEGAVRLVASGVATRVSLGAMEAAESVAPSGAAIAQRYGVCFALERQPDGRVAILIGPRDVR